MTDDWIEFGPMTEHFPTKKRRRRRKPELDMQNQIARWLLGRHVVLAITDAGALNKMGLGMRCGIPVGWPDLTCCVPPTGRFLGVECKAPGGAQSREQKIAQDRIEAAGGVYLLVDSIENLEKLWDCLLTDLTR